MSTWSRIICPAEVTVTLKMIYPEMSAVATSAIGTPSPSILPLMLTEPFVIS